MLFLNVMVREQDPVRVDDGCYLQQMCMSDACEVFELTTDDSRILKHGLGGIKFDLIHIWFLLGSFSKEESRRL